METIYTPKGKERAVIGDATATIGTGGSTPSGCLDVAHTLSTMSLDGMRTPTVRKTSKTLAEMSLAEIGIKSVPECEDEETAIALGVNGVDYVVPIVDDDGNHILPGMDDYVRNALSTTLGLPNLTPLGSEEIPDVLEEQMLQMFKARFAESIKVVDEESGACVIPEFSEKGITQLANQRDVVVKARLDRDELTEYRASMKYPNSLDISMDASDFVNGQSPFFPISHLEMKLAASSFSLKYEYQLISAVFIDMLVRTPPYLVLFTGLKLPMWTHASSIIRICSVARDVFLSRFNFDRVEDTTHFDPSEGTQLFDGTHGRTPSERDSYSYFHTLPPKISPPEGIEEEEEEEGEAMHTTDDIQEERLTEDTKTSTTDNIRAKTPLKSSSLSESDVAYLTSWMPTVLLDKHDDGRVNPFDVMNLWMDKAMSRAMKMAQKRARLSKWKSAKRAQKQLAKEGSMEEIIPDDKESLTEEAKKEGEKSDFEMGEEGEGGGEEKDGDTEHCVNIDDILAFGEQIPFIGEPVEDWFLKVRSSIPGDRFAKFAFYRRYVIQSYILQVYQSDIANDTIGTASSKVGRMLLPIVRDFVRRVGGLLMELKTPSFAIPPLLALDEKVISGVSAVFFKEIIRLCAVKPEIKDDIGLNNEITRLCAKVATYFVYDNVKDTLIGSDHISATALSPPTLGSKYYFVPPSDLTVIRCLASLQPYLDPIYVENIALPTLFSFESFHVEWSHHSYVSQVANLEHILIEELANVVRSPFTADGSDFSTLTPEECRGVALHAHQNLQLRLSMESLFLQLLSSRWVPCDSRRKTGYCLSDDPLYDICDASSLPPNKLKMHLFTRRSGMLTKLRSLNMKVTPLKSSIYNNLLYIDKRGYPEYHLKEEQNRCVNENLSLPELELVGDFVKWLTTLTTPSLRPSDKDTTQWYSKALKDHPHLSLGDNMEFDTLFTAKEQTEIFSRLESQRASKGAEDSDTCDSVAKEEEEEEEKGFTGHNSSSHLPRANPRKKYEKRTPQNRQRRRKQQGKKTKIVSVELTTAPESIEDTAAITTKSESKPPSRRRNRRRRTRRR